MPHTAVQREELHCAFRQCIRRLRHEADISQERLALEAGLDRGYMGKLEKGQHSPSLETLYKLLPPLGISFTQFAAEFEGCLKKCRRRTKALPKASCSPPLPQPPGDQHQ